MVAQAAGPVAATPRLPHSYLTNPALQPYSLAMDREMTITWTSLRGTTYLETVSAERARKMARDLGKMGIRPVVYQAQEVMS